MPFTCTWTEVINGGSDEVTVQEAVQLLIEVAGEVLSFFTRGLEDGLTSMFEGTGNLAIEQVVTLAEVTEGAIDVEET